METAYESAIEQIAQSVFTTMLSIDLIRLERAVPPAATELLATVSIAGAWTGKVVLTLSHELARQATAIMLQVPPEDVSDADARDVAAELVNMVGGNLKSILPGPSYLTLPTIISGCDIGLHMHAAELVEDVALACDSGTVRVALYSKPQE